MSAFFRFPHTPHLGWFGSGAPRADKVLAPAEANELLATEVIIEEKVDGANLGFSVDEHAELRAQNRGHYLDLTALSGQWKPLRHWLASRRYALVEALAPNLMLFGEWCFAVHSVRYSRLPDWFVAFDVYDRASMEFWSAARRDELVARLDIAAVPKLGHGRYDLAAAKALLGRSRLGDDPAEGLYVRHEENGTLVSRAKLVRPEFVQAIDEHWSKRALVQNQLA